ncbi:TetR/AcrR family transcriptional regulator [Silvibacterium sp.]|uniref:TetR/AcrR family transcriptional regulator n=1 Tax=Silvibacterium sp. TaxID=1964179 RepID=UPI0039E305EC
MPQSKPNKHEVRTRETRERLLRAAEEVFIRDGYEQADLNEIAKLAGRTKGSIYTQFKSKEDIFLALVETHSLRRRAAMREQLSVANGTESNLAVMRDAFLSFSSDETWALLLLEFKLYAIRHPESKERLREVYATITPENPEAIYAALLGEAKGKTAIRRTEAVHAGFSMLSGLIVEMRSASHVGSETARVIAGRLFDVLFENSKDEALEAGKATRKAAAKR